MEKQFHINFPRKSIARQPLQETEVCDPIQLRRKYRMPPRQATHSTSHIAMPTTSITSFSVRSRVLRRHNKPLRRRGNHHQQSSDCRTVGVPIRPKHKIPGLITIMEDRQQDRMPIKGRGIDDEKIKEGGERKKGKKGEEKTGERITGERKREQINLTKKNTNQKSRNEKKRRRQRKSNGNSRIPAKSQQHLLPAPNAGKSPVFPTFGNLSTQTL